MTELERVVSRAKWGRGLFVGAISVICLALISAIAFAIVVNFQQETKITRVEQSACAQDPTSGECQKVKRESDEAQSIADTCIAFWKVGYACPRPGSMAEQRQINRRAGLVDPAGGAAIDPGPEPDGGDGALAPADPDSDGPAVPAPGGSGDPGPGNPPVVPLPSLPAPDDTPPSGPPPAVGGKGEGPSTAGPVIEVPPLLPHTPPEKPVCVGRVACVGL